VNIEQLTKYNFYENSVDYFNRKHEVKRVYRRKDDKYELIEHPYIEDWSLDERHQLARKISSDQYVTYLAIENDNIIGFVSLKKELVMNKYMILAEMYISGIIEVRDLEKNSLELEKMRLKGHRLRDCIFLRALQKKR